MSIAIMTEVWKLDLPDSEKIVMLALADCANDEGLAWPSMATLARKCTKSERTCQTVIKALAGKGLLKRDEVIGKGCKYLLTPRKDSTPAAAAPPQRTTKTPAAAAPKPSSNPSVTDVTGADAPIDPVKRLFDLGVDLLTSTGTKPESARSYLGKLRKDHGDDRTLMALIEARRLNITNPVEWLPKRLNSNPTASNLDTLAMQARRYAPRDQAA